MEWIGERIKDLAKSRSLTQQNIADLAANGTWTSRISDSQNPEYALHLESILILVSDHNWCH